MLRIYGCIVAQHDLWPVALAGLIAFGGCVTAMSLLRRAVALAAAEDAAERWSWLVAAALAAGITVTSAHFVALLAYRPIENVTFSLPLTSLSLLAAVALSGIGFVVAAHTAGSRLAAAAGGAVVGLGIAAMHGLGMLAFVPWGLILWDTPMLAAAVGLGVALAAAALVVALAPGGRPRLAAGGLLALAVLAHHFVCLTAANLLLGGRLEDRAWLTPERTGGGVALACAAIVLLTFAQFHRSARNARQAAAEGANMRDFADISVEGLVVCDGGHILAANRSFEALVGIPRETLPGRALASLFLDRQLPGAGLDDETETERVLAGATGERIPVEVVAKVIAYGGRSRRVVAFRDLRERRRAEDKIRFLASHDPLTGLANRACFVQRLERQLHDTGQVPRPFAVLAIDLDRFKAVNDSLGHMLGDLLLTRVADRLRAAVRDADLIARLGGDEFAVLQAGGAHLGGAAAMAARIVEVVGRPYIVEGKIVNIGASVGLTMAPADARDASTLMKNADLALHKAKAEGRGTFRFFEQALDARMQQRRTLELDLRRAIARQEFELFYQPQFGFGPDRITGFEALIRWRHPERGLVPPSDFIPLAEETGLIAAIGEWALNAAAAQAASWDEDVGMAVNLSPVQFRNRNLAGLVRTALRRAGLAPHRLELEITESVLLQDSEETLAVLHDLRSLGVRVAMDDFGTGYSSLSYLRSFPFDKIKIDRSFVAELTTNAECAAIVRAIAGLGHNLGIGITAEGVETPEQLERIRIEGCDTVQGYLIGRPMPAAEATVLLLRDRLRAAVALPQDAAAA